VLSIITEEQERNRDLQEFLEREKEDEG